MRFPPPFIYAAGFLAGLMLERWGLRLHLGGRGLRAPLVVGGWLVILAGLFIIGWALWTLWRAKTGILPFRPARLIVETGPYRFTRNPMYVGLAALYLGLSFLFDAGWPVLLLPLVLLSIFRVVIQREERYLTSAFGDEYVQYQSRVRRWL